MSPYLRSDLCPICPHDNSVMVYQPTYLALRNVLRPSVFERFLSSYGCAKPGCDARFRHTQGYFTVKGPPDSPTMIPITEINIAKCPDHGYWLYVRKRGENEKDIAWCCGVRECEYVLKTHELPEAWAR
jgi:hypothetical protein